jgi:hypothetical protein
MLPNTMPDLIKIRDLLDRIPVARGGSMEIAGVWASDRNFLIAEVAAQITIFQTVNRRTVIDGAVDPRGGTLNLMNQLAVYAPGTVSAQLAPTPAGFNEVETARPIVADPLSVAGFGQLRNTTPEGMYIRRLVEVDGCSIKWFGVLIPLSDDGDILTATPHIHFTPTPIQGGYHDASYESFAGWAQLWADYTDIPGGQITAAGANQILITPFYQTRQQRDLGDFLFNWKTVIKAVCGAVINWIDPFRLRDNYEFNSIVSSSFSNGWVAHQQFHTKGYQVEQTTDVLFDLDGVAGGSNWRPPKGIIYLNRSSPARQNPVAGNQFYVGGRWNNFARFYPGGLNTHACCRNHLLYHGVKTFCT